jgi:hypothetical protein
MYAFVKLSCILRIRAEKAAAVSWVFWRQCFRQLTGCNSRYYVGGSGCDQSLQVFWFHLWQRVYLERCGVLFVTCWGVLRSTSSVLNLKYLNNLYIRGFGISPDLYTLRPYWFVEDFVRKNLSLIDRGDLRHSSQDICRSLRFRCRLFILTCFGHFVRWSSCSPQYFSFHLVWMWIILCEDLKANDGSRCKRDLSWLYWLNFTRNRWNHVKRRLSWYWNCPKSKIGLSWVDIKAVLSAKVAVILIGVVGFYTVQEILDGPTMLHWGTLNCIW